MKSQRRLSPTAAMLLAFAATATSCAKTGAGSPAPESSRRTLIVHAKVLDGTGAGPRQANVRIAGDRIVAVGDLQPESADSVVDAGGLVLAPGFIDTHSHADRQIFDHRDALAAVSQGITTIVVGQDGGSAIRCRRSLRAWNRHRRRSTWPATSATAPSATSSWATTSAGTRRLEEIRRMPELVREGMRAGALGLSTGLEYDPGIYSGPSEVLALARTAGEMGGRYISHIRSEDRYFWKAVEEIIAIGRTTGMTVQISHAKLAMRSLWNQGDSLIRMLDRARASGVKITADLYPYTYWQSNLGVLLPERNFEDRAAAQFALDEVAPPEGLLLSAYAPEPSYVGKTVADMADSGAPTRPPRTWPCCATPRRCERRGRGVTRREDPARWIA